MFNRMKFQSLVLFLLLACFSAAISAQTTGSGTISGTITDPSGASVPGVAVTVRDTSTGIERSLTTNEAGIYHATFLPPGSYDITATKEGFAKVIRQALTLQVGQILTLDIAMPLRATQESVTVTGEAPLVDTGKTDVSQVVSQNYKENLPLAGRNWALFVLLTPNVTNDGGSGLVSYRGISGLYNSSAVDGTNNNQAFFSEQKGRTGMPYVYSMDSIQEYQVTSSNYSAELGQAAGGVINAVTKSGGNVLHGDLFYYLRYPSLNALDPLQKSKGIYTQPIHQQQQFGFSVGGPVIRDKLFYFLTYDGSRKVNPISYTSTVNFPQACVAAIPAATCAAANAFVVSQLGAFARFQNQDIAFGKLDYSFNASNRLNASFNFNNFRSPNSYNPATTSVGSSLSQNGKSVFHERNLVANWSSSFSATLINNLRFQWSRDLEIQAANGTPPYVTISGSIFAYGMPNALPRPAFPDEHRLQFADVLSKVHGTHTFKMGVDLNFVHELLINLFNGGGGYTYSGAGNFSNWVADNAGVNLGDNLTGRHFSSFTQVNDPVTGKGKDDFYNNDYAFFFEDSWKAKRNLTLNLGVRYDISTVPQPPKPNTSTPLTTLYTSTINIPHNQFAPRLGMAWEISKGTVLRAGYGIFYAKTSNSMYYATRAENGVIQQSFTCTPSTCPLLRFPNLIFTPPAGSGTPAAPFAGALVPQIVPFTPPSAAQVTRGQVPDWRNPVVHEGEVAIERRLPWNMVVSATYLFSRGLRLPVFIDTNVAPSTTTRTYDITSSTGSTLSTVTTPFYNVRPDPTGVILTGFSDANSWYNGLVFTLRRSMSHGLEFTFNYTLSKATDNGALQGNVGTFNGGGTNFPVDPKNRRLEIGPSDLDQRQRFTSTVVYSPEWGKKLSNPAAKFLASGWNFSSIVLVATGQPVTGGINGAAPPPGGLLGGLTGGASANFGGPLTGARVYNEPRNKFTGPGVGNVDFRIGRQFAITERFKLALIGEAFNLFNFTNVYGINVTEYNFAAAGSGVCAGHTNACVAQNPTFFAPTSTNNALSGARQLQISGRFSF